MAITIELKPLDALVKHPEFQVWVDEYIEECKNDNVAAPGFFEEKYRAAEDAGTLRTIAVMDGEHLAGAAELQVTKAAHYDFPLVAVDAFYLRKAWRKGRTGIAFLKAAKDAAAAEGSRGLVFMAPPESTLDKLCAKLGMVNTHKAYWCAA